MSRLPWHEQVQILDRARVREIITAELVVAERSMTRRRAEVRLAELVEAMLLAQHDHGYSLTLIGRAELEDRQAQITRGDGPKSRSASRSTSKLPPLSDPSIRGRVGVPYMIGSESSRDGAIEALRTLPKVMAKVYRALAEAGRAGLTHHELIALIPEHAEGSVRSRCNELVRNSYAEESDERRMSPVGNPVAVSRLVPDLVQEASVAHLYERRFRQDSAVEAARG